MGWEMLSSQGIELVNTITLCVSELMANTIEYAFPSATSLCVTLTITFSQDSSSISVEIEDDGASFTNFEMAVEAVRSAHDVPTLDDRGRGLYLVGNMCSDLFYVAKNEEDIPLNKTVLVYESVA